MPNSFRLFFFSAFSGVFDNNLLNNVSCVLTEVTAAFERFINCHAADQFFGFGFFGKKIVNSFRISRIGFAFNGIDINQEPADIVGLFEVFEVRCSMVQGVDTTADRSLKLLFTFR